MLCAHVRLYAQQQVLTTAKDLLKQMPEEVNPILTHNNVLDMLDFMTAGQKAEVTNRLNGKSEMTHLGEKSATIRLSSSTHIDIHILPFADKDVMVCLIETTETADSLMDSKLKMYDSRWQPAGDAHQMKGLHPACFNAIEIDPQTNNLTVVESRRQLTFDGDSVSDQPFIVQTRHATWDSRKGVFKFTD